MMASNFPVSARFRAAKGISNAPGTRTKPTSFFFAPERNSPSYALNRSLSVMKALNRKALPGSIQSPFKRGKIKLGWTLHDKSFLVFFLRDSVPPQWNSPTSRNCHPERSEGPLYFAGRAKMHDRWRTAKVKIRDGGIYFPL